MLTANRFNSGKMHVLYHKPIWSYLKGCQNRLSLNGKQNKLVLSIMEAVNKNKLHQMNGSNE